MSTADHGLEVLRKSSEIYNGIPSESILRVNVAQGTISSVPGPFSPPSNSDHVSISLSGGGFIVDYAFKVGGISGTVLKTVSLQYATVQVLELVEVSLS